MAKILILCYNKALMEKLKEKIKGAPKSPGVYRFLGKENEILYIGKAKNLKNRLGQYLLREGLSRVLIAQMMPLVTSCDWTKTESEIEAVILEAELIRKLKPKYNIRLKDDKSFLVIKITREDYPKVEFDRIKNVDFKSKDYEVFGPYPTGDVVRRSLKYLRKIFPFYDCSKTKLNLFKKKNRTCLYGDLRVCPGICQELVSKGEYEKNIKDLKTFLKGGKKRLISRFRKEMESCARAKKFEEAALFRNKLLALEKINQVSVGLKDILVDNNQYSASFKRIEFYDISNIFGRYSTGSMAVMTDGQEDKKEYRRFKIKDENQSDIRMVYEVIKRRFNHNSDEGWAIPDLIGIDGGIMQLKAAKEALIASDIDIPIFSISKGKKRDKNDFHFLDRKIAEVVLKDEVLKRLLIHARDEAHRFAIGYYRKLHKKELFL